MMLMNFFMPMVPPRTTAQQKRVGVTRTGKQVRYEGEKLADAHAKLRAYLAPHNPPEPIAGPVRLVVKWLYLDKSAAHPDGSWKITRPDTDNLQKMLKDVMTECRFWHDDAQVCSEIAEKFWVRRRCGIYVEVHALEDVGAGC